MIKTFGYFDAHHEPMKHFLFDPENADTLEIDPMFFPLENMTSVLNKIIQTDIFLGRVYRISSRNVRLQKQQISTVKSLRQDVGAVKNRFRYSLMSAVGKAPPSRYFDRGHPLVRLMKKNAKSEVVGIPIKELGEFLGRYYTRAVKSTFLPEAIDFVNSFYEHDIESHKCLLQFYGDGRLEEMPRASTIFEVAPIGAN